jgi:hypothetical protein
MKSVEPRQSKIWLSRVLQRGHRLAFARTCSARRRASRSDSTLRDLNALRHRGAGASHGGPRRNSSRIEIMLEAKASSVPSQSRAGTGPERRDRFGLQQPALSPLQNARRRRERDAATPATTLETRDARAIGNLNGGAGTTSETYKERERDLNPRPALASLTSNSRGYHPTLSHTET